MQGDVDTSLRGAVVLFDTVHIGQDILDAEGVLELLQVELVEELGHALDALTQIGRHRSLAVALDTLILERHLHIGGGGAAIACQIESVAQFQLVREERQFQFAGLSYLIYTGHTAATLLGYSFNGVNRHGRCGGKCRQTHSCNKFSTIHIILNFKLLADWISRRGWTNWMNWTNWVHSHSSLLTPNS